MTRKKSITIKQIEEITKYLDEVYSNNKYKVERCINNKFFLVRNLSEPSIITRTIIEDLSKDSFNFKFVCCGIDDKGLYGLFTEHFFYWENI